MIIILLFHILSQETNKSLNEIIHEQTQNHKLMWHV
jgi:hypothetical protein